MWILRVKTINKDVKLELRCTTYLVLHPLKRIGKNWLFKDFIKPIFKTLANYCTHINYLIKKNVSFCDFCKYMNKCKTI